MNDKERARIIADEDATEREYKAHIPERARNFQRSLNESVNNTWTDRPTTDAPSTGELVGRVALAEPSDIIDDAREFYIGDTHCEFSSYQVFNWTAPVAACTFYGKTPDRPVMEELSTLVAGRRTITHRNGKVADFEDQAMEGTSSDELFPRRGLNIPRAPRPKVTASDQPEIHTEDSHPVASARESHTESQPISSTQPPTASTAPTSPPPPGPALRAPGLLRRELAAPKKSSMATVLATLQVDQYDVITKPPSENQILQGHPGTGKTIIAAHRAAFLLSEHATPEGRLRGRVIVIGPTAEYVEHVRSAVGRLVDYTTDVEVIALPTLLEQLIGLPRSTVPTRTVAYTDVDRELARLVDLAYTRTRKNSESGQRPDRASIYAELVWLLQDPPDNGLNGEWAKYLRQLPSTYQELLNQHLFHHRGLMAYISVRAEPRKPSPAHVIVDEAQDIHPIEWEVLGRLGNSGGWTILGDLNQRRTDHTFSSWDEVAELLAIEDEQSKAPVQMLERGYRSTAQIIHFANQLLPRGDRVLYSLQQEGEKPTVTRITSAGKLVESVVHAADALCEKVGEGTVAVITVNTEPLRRLLLRHGWTSGSTDPSMWTNAERTLRLLPPERARGLEFDGVVVVEPADFPENVGRLGVLYTALTRANRFLTVVYHRALPRGLKAQ